ncbi:MAG: hypothetical protein ABSB76_24535 [Streptosporangiaceae bacterium]|jgi:hypothetical protein
MATQAADAGARAGWLRGIGAVHEEGWTAPDVRRRLQLVLAGIWLLDAVLQFQAFMFGRGFSQMLGGTAVGNPAVIADPINWSAKIIADHPTATNAVFAFIQLAIGLGIAWRPTLKLALGASIGWALGVWWFGEGLGGVLNGAGGPANGAPGAVIIYALLAVLLWPGAHDRAAHFVAGRFTGVNAARALWLVLWGSLAYLALQPATRAPKALGGMVSGMASGQPGWLASLDNHLGAFGNSHGPAVAVVLAVVLALVAVSVYLPRPAARAGVVLAVVTAAFIWLAEGLGGILTGGGTDPNSGLLLALLALAYWPLASAALSVTGRPDVVAATTLESPEGA